MYINDLMRWVASLITSGGTICIHVLNSFIEMCINTVDISEENTLCKSVQLGESSNTYLTCMKSDIFASKLPVFMLHVGKSRPSHKGTPDGIHHENIISVETLYCFDMCVYRLNM